jgi:hypothetical protein
MTGSETAVGAWLVTAVKRYNETTGNLLMLLGWQAMYLPKH